MLQRQADRLAAESDVALFHHEAAFDKLMKAADEAVHYRQKAGPDKDYGMLQSKDQTNRHQFECLLVDVAQEFTKARRKLNSAARKHERIVKELRQAEKELKASEGRVNLTISA
jgi:hypothetical protein